MVEVKPHADSSLRSRGVWQLVADGVTAGVSDAPQRDSSLGAKRNADSDPAVR